jgi:hypothetical protein
MPGFLVLLFWCWFAVSAAILVRRAFRRVTSEPRSSHPAAAAGTASPVTAAGTASPVAAVAPPPAVALGDVATAAPVTPGAPTPASTATVAPGAVATIADALRGIRLPCDLAPLTGSGGGDEARRVAFYTVGYPAAAVAPQVADELERLGMRFDALTDNAAVAWRDDARVRVTVRTVGTRIGEVADLTYPTAPEHSVVVEFELA